MTKIKTILFILFCAPAIAAIARLPNAADPAAALTHTTGEWAIRLLLLTLAITPLRHLTGITKLLQLRRLCGLFAFAYIVAHFNVYMHLDLQLDFALLAEDIIERKYITVGFAAFILLIPLAITSTNGMIKRLGAKKWQKLHKLVYIIAILSILHYLWLKKGEDLTGVAVHAAILTSLLICRLKKPQQILTKLSTKLNKNNNRH